MSAILDLHDASLPKIIRHHGTHSLSVITNTRHIRTSPSTQHIHLTFQMATSVLIITTACTPNSINTVLMSILQLNFEQKLLISNHRFVYVVFQTTKNFIIEVFKIISVVTKT
jgi:hypothetical protein